jgi:mercuric ion transport protein
MARTSEIGHERWLAAGALVSALAASTCCIVPLIFVSLGISGAWIGTLTTLAPYQPLFLAVSAICIAGGFWSAYRRRACPTPTCGTPVSRGATMAALWVGTLIVLVAASAEWWAFLLA